MQVFKEHLKQHQLRPPAAIERVPTPTDQHVSGGSARAVIDAGEAGTCMLHAALHIQPRRTALLLLLLLLSAALWYERSFHRCDGNALPNAPPARCSCACLCAARMCTHDSYAHTCTPGTCGVGVILGMC